MKFSSLSALAWLAAATVVLANPAQFGRRGGQRHAERVFPAFDGIDNGTTKAGANTNPGITLIPPDSTPASSPTTTDQSTQADPTSSKPPDTTTSDTPTTTSTTTSTSTPSTSTPSTTMMRSSSAPSSLPSILNSITSSISGMMSSSTAAMPSSMTSSSNSTSTSSSSSGGGSSTALIVGSVAGFVVILAVGFGYAFFSKVRKNRRKDRVFGGEEDDIAAPAPPPFTPRAGADDSLSTAGWEPDYKRSPSPLHTPSPMHARPSPTAAARQLHDQEYYPQQYAGYDHSGGYDQHAGYEQHPGYEPQAYDPYGQQYPQQGYGGYPQQQQQQQGYGGYQGY